MVPTRVFSMIDTTRVNSPLHVICNVLKEKAGPCHTWHLDNDSSLVTLPPTESCCYTVGVAVIFVTCRLVAWGIYSAIKKKKGRKKKKELRRYHHDMESRFMTVHSIRTDLMLVFFILAVLFIYCIQWFNIINSSYKS